VTRYRTPRLSVLFPNIGEPTLDRFSGQRNVASRLDGLRTHDDGNIAVDANEFDLPLERGVIG
jgi:hypothetical protein